MTCKGHRLCAAADHIPAGCHGFCVAVQYCAGEGEGARACRCYPEPFARGDTFEVRNRFINIPIIAVNLTSLRRDDDGCIRHRDRDHVPSGREIDRHGYLT